ncbi:hypothetical protein HanIR_Chr12g0611351 [Helianthus annuus]|nr:hypothetical protein HanIR_Chr12g0611351 [Helianthus annuus]
MVAIMMLRTQKRTVGVDQSAMKDNMEAIAIDESLSTVILNCVCLCVMKKMKMEILEECLYTHGKFKSHWLVIKDKCDYVNIDK